MIVYQREYAFQLENAHRQEQRVGVLVSSHFIGLFTGMKSQEGGNLQSIESVNGEKRCIGDHLIYCVLQIVGDGQRERLFFLVMSLCKQDQQTSCA